MKNAGNYVLYSTGSGSAKNFQWINVFVLNLEESHNAGRQFFSFLFNASFFTLSTRFIDWDLEMRLELVLALSIHVTNFTYLLV